MHFRKKFNSVILASILCLSAVQMPLMFENGVSLTTEAANVQMSDMPKEYKFAADWIWENRILTEDSTGKRSLRWNSLYDQIIDGKGTINYVVRWQSHKTVTLEQRKQFEKLLSDAINDWNKWLAGYEEWPYEHINVKIVGWAVIDESCLLDRQPNETVYTNLTYYDSQYDTSNGYEIIPDQLPNAPDELSRMEHFFDKSYKYPGGTDKRFDMYMWATEGFPAIGGCGGDWGQRLSDTAYLNMLDGNNIHVLEHELGHCFGMTDFYGGEGASDGFPPGGFPGGENSIMMAGSASKITDFDGWMLRYIWTKIKEYPGRFNAEDLKSSANIGYKSFEDEITKCGKGYVVFAKNGKFTYGSNYYGSDESKNLANYEKKDKVSISFRFNEATKEITDIDSLTLITNGRTENVTTTTNTTAKPIVTTTTTTTKTTSTPSRSKNVVLNDVTFGESYSLEKYDYNSINKIVVKFDDKVGYGFSGSMVLGNWAVSTSYESSELSSDNTITFNVTNPQNSFTMYRYWGTVGIKSVTLCFK